MPRLDGKNFPTGIGSDETMIEIECIVKYVDGSLFSTVIRYISRRLKINIRLRHPPGIYRK